MNNRAAVTMLTNGYNNALVRKMIHGVIMPQPSHLYIKKNLTTRHLQHYINSMENKLKLSRIRDHFIQVRRSNLCDEVRRVDALLHQKEESPFKSWAKKHLPL